MESTIELSVFKKEIHFIKKDSLTTGQQRNSMKITFNGKEWDKLTKFGVFKVENVVRYVLITSPDIEIPAEVCTIDNLGKVVYFGIKGTSTEVIDGTKTGTVYNTPYFRLGVLERGTEVSGSIPEYPSSNTLDSAIETARRWAIGPNSTDKVPTDKNNAKYWSEQAQKFANILSEAGNNESDRIKAEKERQNAEQNRQNNENIRQSNEAAREVWENYNQVKTYYKGNKVSFNGNSYVCVVKSTANQPGQSNDWLLIAQKGNGLAIKDKYTTIEELRAANPDHIYTYQVEQPNGELYIYSNIAKDWVSIGTIQSGGGSLPVEVDLSDSITLSPDNLFASSTSIGSNKSIGEKIRQAALEHDVNVTVMLKFEDREPEKVTLQMFGTQSTLNDGTLVYSLTGTYVWAGTFPIDIMIGTNLHETDCTIIQRIESLTQKPIYDPVDKSGTMSNGAFLQWNSEQKTWTAETTPIAHQFSINNDGDLILTYIGDPAPNYSINEYGDLIMTSESGEVINLGRVRGENGDSIDITGAKDGDVLRVRGGKVVTEQVPMFIDLNAINIYVEPDNSNLVFDVSQDTVTKLIEAAKSGGALFKFGYGKLNDTIPVQVYLSGSVVETEQLYLFDGRVFFDSDSIADISFSVQPDKDKPKVATACVFGQFLPAPKTSDNGAFLRVQNGNWAMVQIPTAEGATF